MVKSFKANLSDALAAHPATAFITPPAPAAAQEQANAAATAPSAEAAQTARPSAPAGETKSRRLQLLVKPSSVDFLKRRSAALGISVNELANRLFEDAAKREGVA